ncbi:MAG: mycofactocin-associated electron transfer flavoprotein alpha subunit [Ilumatobacteraceae bacterium]
MLAVVPVRDGVVPAGGAETVAECGGRTLLVGSSPDDDALAGVGRDVQVLELGAFAAGRWSDALAPLLADEHLVVLPGSPDGRDLAPRLAHALDRPLLAGAIRVSAIAAQLARGTHLHDFTISGPVVVTLQPGVRGIVVDPASECLVRGLPAPDTRSARNARISSARDATVVEVLPPDVATMDLIEADRIFGGGAGLEDEERFVQLTAVASALGASMGATRVITDRGWVAHQRQIGTTGVVVDPTLYVALGVSGAVQHTAGLGTPDHIVSVNTDAHCPMMQLADLAVVADANAVLDELVRLLTPSPQPIGVAAD